MIVFTIGRSKNFELVDASDDDDDSLRNSSLLAIDFWRRMTWVDLHKNIISSQQAAKMLISSHDIHKSIS
jgi:hypothetical protein